MSKRIPLCATILLAIIAIVSFAIVYLVLHHHKPCKDGTCVVKIDLGHLRGREKKSTLNQKTFYSFQGIPYAKPPTESLRFKDPEPIEHWHTVIEATKQKDMCIQRGPSRERGDVKGSEDCLYLNIYTSQFPDHDVVLHPVMVSFHGGGFSYGNVIEDHYGADYLVEREIVLVTVSYRLAAFGFINLNNAKVSGNAGLKDQRLALRWIKEHISHFGGDPNNVTIFGTSAGSASVQYHILSPSSAGLFHKAIMQSGSSLNPWAFDDDPIGRAEKLAKSMGFNKTDETADHNELAEFLIKQSAEDIVFFQEQTRSIKELNSCISFTFSPSIETYESEGRFLPEHPLVILQENKFNHVPVIVGAVKNEGLIALMRSDFVIYFNGSDFGRYIPLELHLEPSNPQFKTIAQSIKEFYFENKPVTLDDLDHYFDICGDLEFNIGIQKSIDYFTQFSSLPVYVYKFSHEGPLCFLKANIRNNWPSITLPKGTSHADEHNYLFSSTKSENISDSEELKMIDEMTSRWTHFAITQDPNDKDYEQWSQCTKENQTYLEFGPPTISTEGPLLSQEKSKFWSNIYKIVNEKKRRRK